MIKTKIQSSTQSPNHALRNLKHVPTSLILHPIKYRIYNNQETRTSNKKYTYKLQTLNDVYINNLGL